MQGWKISRYFRKYRIFSIFLIYIRYFRQLCLRIKICINCDTISCCCVVIILTLQIYVISSEYILISFQILTKQWVSEWVSIIVNQLIWHSLQIKCATDMGWPLLRCGRQVLWVLSRMHCIGGIFVGGGRWGRRLSTGALARHVEPPLFSSAVGCIWTSRGSVYVQTMAAEVL